MRGLHLIILGLGFTALSLVLPALHLSPTGWVGLPTLLQVALAFPVVVLVIALRSSGTWWRLVWYPLAHFPAFVIEPELCGPMVYGGERGLFAWIVVALVGIGWLLCAMSTTRAPSGTRRVRLAGVSAVTFVLSLALFSVWLAPAWSVQVTAPAASNMTVIVGALVVISVLPLGRRSGSWGHSAAAEEAMSSRRWIAWRPRRVGFRPAACVSVIALAVALLWYTVH